MSELPLIELRGRGGRPIAGGHSAELRINGHLVTGVRDVVIHVSAQGVVECDIKLFCRLASAHETSDFESAIEEVLEKEKK